MKESQRENILLYKDYADPELYSRIMELERVQICSAARSVFVMLSMQYDLPYDVTSEYLAELDADLRTKNTSLSAIINTELARVIKEDEEFKAIKDSEEFRKEYEAYAENWEYAVIH